MDSHLLENAKKKSIVWIQSLALLTKPDVTISLVCLTRQRGKYEALGIDKTRKPRKPLKTTHY